jgi:hypothetical protein
MRNASQGANLTPIKFGLPEPDLVIELDVEAGLIAFRAAERDLVASGFGDMDEVGAYATKHMAELA